MSRGDSTLVDGTPLRLNILAGVPYRIEWCTVTWARRPEVGDPLTCDILVEINGDKPEPNDIVPIPICEGFIYNCFELT